MTDDSQTKDDVAPDAEALRATAEKLAAAAEDAKDADEVVAEAEALADAVGATPSDDEDGDAVERVKADVDNDALDHVLVKRVLEAAILVADGPLSRDAMLLLFDEAERPSRKQLNEIIESLSEDCEKRGIELREVASGLRFQVKKDLGPWVSRMWQEKPPRYSRAILETLALIAYRQPITRGEIEEIRGVSVNTQIVRTLLERGWARVVGHRDVPGRPAMYATTRQFLDYFDLKSLEDLPPLSEIKDLDKLNEELQLEETVQLAQEAHDHAHSGDGDGADGADSEQQSLIDVMDQEPEIDESTLMSLEQVDAVLSEFEEQFRKKPKADAEAAAQAELAADSASQGAADGTVDGDAGEPDASDDSDTHGEAGDAAPDAEMTPQDTKTADIPNE